MNIKKALLTGTSYAAVAALAIGGTVAYLNDQTETDVNVMTMGNVSIEQHEYQRADGVSHINDGAVEGDLVAFEQGKTIIPAVPANGLGSDYTAEPTDLFNWGVYSPGANGLWNDDKLSNVVDKFVFVENTGKTDAYYRTVIAFECPEGTEYSEGSDKEFMMNVNGNSRFAWEDCGYVTIDGVRYLLMSATYNEVLVPEEVSRPSLLQVVMTHNATNEDVELLGDTYEILVLSQAVQADKNLTADAMLDDAFGEVNATNAAEWFVDQVAAAPEAGAVRPAAYVPSTEGEVIDHLIITDNSDDSTNLRALYNGEGGAANYTTGDIYVLNSSLDGTYAMNLYAVEGSGAELIVENTELKGWISYTGFASASFTDCTFDENSNPEIYKTIRPYDDTVFTNCDFAAGYEFWLDQLAGSTITLVDCTIGGVEITSADQLNIVCGDASSVVIG